MRVKIICLTVGCAYALTEALAQDAYLSPAFDLAVQRNEHPEMFGGSISLRMPIGATRYWLELRPSLLQSGWVKLPDTYERRDSRIGGALTCLRSERINAFSFDFGLEVGWGRRRVELHYYSSSSVLVTQTLVVGSQLALRYTRSQAIQPVVALCPFYEHPLKRSDVSLIDAATDKGSWGTFIRCGFVWRLPVPSE